MPAIHKRFGISLTKQLQVRRWWHQLGEPADPQGAQPGNQHAVGNNGGGYKPHGKTKATLQALVRSLEARESEWQESHGRGEKNLERDTHVLVALKVVRSMNRE
jgi:hypothetical protein